MNIAIVVAEFNQKITSRMLDVALEKAKMLKLHVKHVCRVPGVFDMPLVIDSLLQKKYIEAVITLGAVIKGQTRHDELIANISARAISDLAIKYQKPVTLGISGPGMQERHAHARIRPVAERAVEAAVKISEQLRKIR
ncbi:MAG: 6,7-dimethyl-8-ribityllumazine synthase [Nitrosopumilaceae archaeon]